MTDRTLRSKVQQLQRLQAELGRLTTQSDELKAAIQSEMQARAVDEYKAGSALVRWKPVVSTRLDVKALQQAHSALYAEFAVPAITRRFTIVSA